LEERLDGDIETVLYRVIQESVNNVIKHAKASQLDISLVKDSHGLSITIEDNGIGFNKEEIANHDGIGLKNIQSRIIFLKGTVEWDSQKGKGTVVVINIPL
jgi:signal transduction histidine kinase